MRQGPALLITGAGSSLGRPLVASLLLDPEFSNTQLLLTSRDIKKLDPLKALSPERVFLFELDLLGDLNSLVAQLGRHDIQAVALLAGDNHDQTLLESGEEDFEMLWKVNTGSHVRLLGLLFPAGPPRLAAPLVFCGSQVGLRGNAGQALYAMAKGHLLDLAKKFTVQGWRANLLLPPLMLSPMLMQLSLETREKLLATRLMADPEPELSAAEQALFLLSRRSSYVAGQAWHGDTRVSVLGFD